ncbi:MAG: glycosyltransferase [Candidatus Rokubacteria bacterium]|nr:glycosyltransferase [Candidatus Rokubacteria bacterium]
MAPPRRLILHTEASLGLGGQEIRILTETRWLLDHGWDALIAGQPESRLLAEARTGGLPIVALPMRSALDARAFRALRHLISARAVAVVHTHSSIDSWLGGLAAKSVGRPVVRSRHVAIPILRRRALVYHLADRVLTTGSAIKAIVERAGVPARKIVSVPAGVDTARFHPGVSGAAVRAELGLAPTTKLVGLVANVRGSKGHRYFLEAAQAVLRAEPATRFLIVGDGIGFDDVRRRVRDMGLEREVIMTGFRRDIPEVMAALDLLVLPSTRSEATSQVIPQALAVGTPVVATSVGGIPEIVSDGETGRLVPPADAAALAGAVLELLGDPAAAATLAEAGRQLVQARYTVDAMMATTTRVYAKLLGG